MAKKPVKLIVREYIKAIKSRNIQVERAILFGSHVTGRDNKDSDIDIAVISADFGRDYVEEAVMLKEISEAIDLDISPRPYSLDEYKRARRGQFLHDEVLAKGKVIEA